MHMQLNFVFKQALHFGTSAIKLRTYLTVVQSYNCYRISLPLNALPPVQQAKLECSILIVVYANSRSNVFCCHINC